MRRMQMKMGKYGTKSNNLGSNNQSQKRLSRDSCLDESNDSGFGPDFTLGLPESNSSSCLEESDVDSSSDSVDSGISCRHRRLIKAKPRSTSSFVSNPTRTSPTALYTPYSMMHIETSLSLSLNRKMHIQQKSDCHEKLTLNEPPTKRRKLIPMIAHQEEKPKRLTVHHYPSETSTTGVLTEASLCTNGIGRSNFDDPLLIDLPRDNRTPDYSTHNGDHIAALLSPNSHSLSRKRSTKKPSLHQPFPHISRDGKVELCILVQPEEQHRARYMTEGSRGSIKDEKGTGFPTVKLMGYRQPVVLQIFIGCDQGKVQPHLFYQACKVTGKNCTPCVERLIDGTCVIEIQLDPSNDMTVSCDCIGILKERNVDVEQRLPYFGLSRCKKRSTKCRMAFRVNIPFSNGTYETLQITSSPILCTQSPGLPEICKKSLTECSAKGGTDLFIIGKNFQKDARIVFTELARGNRNTVLWEESVEPEKEYMHQSHLVCCVPPYCDQEIKKPVRVMLSVSSGGKSSEPHIFTFTPNKEVVKEEFGSLNYELHSIIHPAAVEIKQEWNNESNAAEDANAASMTNMIGGVNSMLPPLIMDPLQDSQNGHTSPNPLNNLNMFPLQHLVTSPVDPLMMSSNTAIVNPLSMTSTEESQQSTLSSSYSLISSNEQPNAPKEVEEEHHDVDLISGINQLANEIVNEQQRLSSPETHLMPQMASSNDLGTSPTRFSQGNCFSPSTDSMKQTVEVITYGPKMDMSNQVISGENDLYLPAPVSSATHICSAPLELNTGEKPSNNIYSTSADEMNQKSTIATYLMSSALSTEATSLSKPMIDMTNTVSESVAMNNVNVAEFGSVSNPSLILSNDKLNGVRNCSEVVSMISGSHLLQNVVSAERTNGQGNLPTIFIKNEKGTVTPTAVAGQNHNMNGFQQSMTYALSQLSDADLLSIINPNTFDSV